MFNLHDTKTAPTGSREILESVQAAWGFVPNLHRVLAESPETLEAYATLWGLFEKTSFSPIERNIVYLAIIEENECQYCMAGHTKLSRMTGVREEHISAIREGRRLDDGKLGALRTFAAKVVRNRGFVSEADIAAFTNAGYDNRAILGVILACAVKLVSNYTNHIAKTPLDDFMKGAEWKAPGRLAAVAA